MFKNYCLLISFCLILCCFVSCTKKAEDNIPTTSSSVNSAVSENSSDEVSAEGTVESNVDSSDTEAEDTSSEASSNTHSNSSATSSKVTSSESPKPKCTHENYFDEGDIFFIGGWYSNEPGIETKYEMPATCEQLIDVIYRCEVCLEGVLYEQKPPKGHDFSGEEEVLVYPSIDKEGCYGKKCKNYGCNETLQTAPIPKRSGDYSTIDSCFTVSVSEFDNCEYYILNSPYICIGDWRTWGSVPVIKYNIEENFGTIDFYSQQGVPVTFYFGVDMDLIEQGYRSHIRIQDDGHFKCWYSKFG